MIYFKTPISFKNNSRSFRIKKTLVIYMPGSLIGRIIISMVCRVMQFKQTINFNLLFNTKYVTQINFDIRLHLSFLIFAALIYLLSYIFRYGQELQQLSDETL